MNPTLGDQLLAAGLVLLAFVVFAVLPLLPRYVAQDADAEKPDPDPEVPRWTL